MGTRKKRGGTGPEPWLGDDWPTIDERERLKAREIGELTNRYVKRTVKGIGVNDDLDSIIEEFANMTPADLTRLRRQLEHERIQDEEYEERRRLDLIGRMGGSKRLKSFSAKRRRKRGLNKR
jgi:hypothetical protein